MKWLTLPLCALALAACSGKPPAPQAQTPPRAAAPWDQLKKDEQKAKDVQKTVDDQAAEERKKIDAAEQ